MIIRSRKLKIFLGVLLVALVIRLILPFAGLVTINHLLKNKLGSYTGQIRDFDLSLWRGAYQLQGLEIKKMNSDLPPLVEIKEIDLSLAWASLIRKELAGHIRLTEPHINLTDSANKENKQNGSEESKSTWQSVFKTIIPIHIESLQVRDGRLEFLNYNFKEPVPVKIDKLNLTASNLRSHAADALSPFNATAEVQGHAKLWIDGKINIMVNPPEGDFDFSLEKFRPSTVNANLRSYVPIDITKGDLSIYGEYATRDKNGKGYIKAFFKDGDIIAPKQSFTGVKHVIIEIVSAFSNWLLKNKDSKSIATEIPIEVEAGKLNINSSSAFWSAVKNQSDELHPGIDHKISFSNLPQNKK